MDTPSIRSMKPWKLGDIWVGKWWKMKGKQGGDKLGPLTSGCERFTDSGGDK